MANADGYVLPKPGIPKTLGILNIIFGVIFTLIGLCGLSTLLFAGPGMQFLEKTVKDAQSARNKEIDKGYDDRIAAAKTDEEKKAIEKEKADAIASRPEMVQPDMTAANETFHNPVIMGVSYVGGISGVILQVMLLISGIGLIRLASWGRSLAVWWGLIQIFQVGVLLVANLLFVQPANKPIVEKQIARAEEIAKTKGANSPEAATLPFTKMMANMALPIAIGSSVLGIIYPVIVLILLSTPGAKAACLPTKAEGEGEF